MVPLTSATVIAAVTLLSPQFWRPSLFRATPRQGPAGWHLDISQTATNAVGRRLGSQPARCDRSGHALFQA